MKMRDDVILGTLDVAIVIAACAIVALLTP
jgi:hypothetical protein